MDNHRSRAHPSFKGPWRWFTRAVRAMSRRTLLLLVTLSVACPSTACTATTRDGEAPRWGDAKEVQPMKVRLKLDKRTLTATLIDSETTRDFVSLLPLTL